MSGVVELVLKFVAHRRLRSFLTTLGVAIGVALVFSLVSINQGMLAYISDTMDELGSDLVMVMPKGLLGGGGFGTAFSQDEVDALERLYFVESAMGFAMGNLPAKIKGQDVNLMILGTDDGITNMFGDISSFEIERGRDFTANERKKLVIGYNIARDHNLGPGSQIEINGEKYRVVGVMSQVGNSQDDSQVYMHIDDFAEITGRESEYIMIYLNTKEPKVEVIERTLERIRGREDFEVSTSEDLMETVNQVLGVLNAVFMAVASISILVGSVGVANTMYMAVAERTREIGIMKAIGATEQDILTIFLLESGLLSLIGGLFGTVLGYGLAKGIGYAAAVGAGMLALQPIFSLELVFWSGFMAFVVGVLSGVFPARYASKLEPVQALRYE